MGNTRQPYSGVYRRPRAESEKGTTLNGSEENTQINVVEN